MGMFIDRVYYGSGGAIFVMTITWAVRACSRRNNAAASAVAGKNHDRRDLLDYIREGAIRP